MLPRTRPGKLRSGAWSFLRKRRLLSGSTLILRTSWPQLKFLVKIGHRVGVSVERKSATKKYSISILDVIVDIRPDSPTLGRHLMWSYRPSGWNLFGFQVVSHMVFW